MIRATKDIVNPFIKHRSFILKGDSGRHHQNVTVRRCQSVLDQVTYNSWSNYLFFSCNAQLYSDVLFNSERMQCVAFSGGVYLRNKYIVHYQELFAWHSKFKLFMQWLRLAASTKYIILSCLKCTSSASPVAQLLWQHGQPLCVYAGVGLYLQHRVNHWRPAWASLLITWEQRSK